MSKITVNYKDKVWTKMELCHRYLPWKLVRFLKVILNDVFQKVISTDNKFLVLAIKFLVSSYAEAATGDVL